MIWRLEEVDWSLVNAFESAGEPDQDVIDAYIAQFGQRGAKKHVGIRRWYYLSKDNPRIRLTTLGMPLEDWHGEAKILVGTGTIIGEFEGNRDYVGQMGLTLHMEPIAWLQGEADSSFSNGSTLLASISEQVLDRREIGRSQAAISQIYRHKKNPSRRKDM